MSKYSLGIRIKMALTSSRNRASLDEARNPNKIWRHLPLRVELASETSVPPPISIEIQPTSACNLRCRWCSYWERNNFDSHKSGFLKADLIDKIVNYASKNSVKSIYLAGGGEPCAYPYIHDIVHKIHHLGISLAMITNGTLFARRLLDIGNYFKYLQVSVISSNSEEYTRVTGSDKGFSDMQKLPKIIKDHHGDRSPIIGGMYVLTQWNYEKAFEVIEFCKNNEFDYCSFRIAVDFENRGVALPEKCFNFLRDGLDKYCDVDSQYTNLEKILNLTYPRIYTPTQCLNTKYGLYATIDTKGGVYICVPDVGKENLCIGSLVNNSFEEIWNSERHREIVQELNKRYCNGECHSDCRSHNYNSIAAVNMPPSKSIPIIHSEFL